MTIDLLICNFNTKDMLIRLLDLLHSDYEPGVWKIYLADNGSTDGSVEWIKDEAMESFYIEDIVFNENIGYAAAINNLAEQSDSEILCAVNADTWFTTNHVKQAAQSFKRHPEAGVIGVKQMDGQCRIRHGGIFWDGKNNPVHRGWTEYDPFDKRFKDDIQCWTVSGSIYYVDRQAWDHAANYQPFRNLFPGHSGAFLPTKLYFEETFASQMMHFLGYQVWYDGTIETAGHTWNGSTGLHTPQLHSLFTESRNIYIDTCNKLGILHECKD